MFGEEDDVRPDCVIDNGTGVIKAGYSGEAEPRVKFASCIGYTKAEAPEELLGEPTRTSYIGPEECIHPYMVLKHPISHGMVENWDEMIQIWQHTFDQLGVQMGEEETNACQGVFLTEAARNPMRSREKACQIFMEHFGCSRFFLGVQAVLALYSSGRLTGLAVDIGAGVTHTVPIFEGYTMPHAIHRSNVAGRDLTTYMVRCLSQVGVYLTTSAEKEIARRIKEEHCYVAMDYDKEIRNFNNGTNPGVTYFMPDGQDVLLKDPLCQVPEFLFDSMKLENVENQSLHSLVQGTVAQCDMDLRKAMYDNIVLSGGTTLIKNLDMRLQMEVQKLAPINATVRVSAPEERYIAVWLGASILASLSTFDKNWVYKHSDMQAYPPVVGYEEAGPRLVHTQCTM